MNNFINSKESYQRNLDIVEAWIRDMTTYLELSTGQSKAICEAFIKKEMVPGGKLEYHNPRTTYLERTDCDRNKQSGTLLGFLKHVVHTRSLMAPSMTVYLHPSKKQSLLSQYIIRNMLIRGKHKKEMLNAAMRGDKEAAAFNKNMQSTFKYKNNSLSGAQASDGTVLTNKSAHPSLTSTCRVSAGYGNANNEKFLAGNRHYWSPSITIANIVSIINNTDLNALRLAMEAFSIRYPTAMETMECILYSSRLYWNDKDEEYKILRLCQGATPLQLAAVVYVSDMYHLAKYNPEFVKTFLERMITIPTTPIAEPTKVLESQSGDIITLASYLCSRLMAGRLLKDLIDPNAKNKEGESCYDPEVYGIVANTAVHLEAVLEEYKVLIKGMWVTPNMPPSIMQLPTMRRRCVLVSDTDSTIFTNQYWTHFYTGKDDWSETSNNVAYVTTFLASQTVMHLLACMSAHLGIVQDNIHRISMKNEYFFPVFVKTSMAKHYYAYVSAQEGNVYAKPKLELKGKNLRDSTVAPAINDKLKEFVKSIMDSIMTKGTVSTGWLLNQVLLVERSIINNIKEGKTSEFTTMRLNDSTAYKNPESSNYRYHDLWTEVFAPKYGSAEAPPYTAIKISITPGSKRKLAKWVEEIEDRALANRLQKWLIDRQVDSLGMLLLPPSILEEKGVPIEIIPVVDFRGIVYSSCVSFYLVLESLGIYSVDDKKNRLLSDIYTDLIPEN